jgi:hypothetical protein
MMSQTMMNNGNDLDNLLRQMVDKGLAFTSHDWIERAVQQKNPRLTLDLACSKLLLYDPVERRLVSLLVFN